MTSIGPDRWPYCQAIAETLLVAIRRGEIPVGSSLPTGAQVALALSCAEGAAAGARLRVEPVGLRP